jgi:aspartate/methionine/tyrosine aminotransferase
MKLAERMQRLQVESAFDVLVRAREIERTGRSVIHLEIGEPDFATPHNVIEAAKEALDDGWTHYGPTRGLPELREAIANYISRTRGIEVGPEHVAVVPGGKPIIFFPMLALLEPGDEVLYPDPGFPIYRSMVEFLGAKAVPIPLVEKRGFAVDLDLLRDSISDRTKMIILNSPQNPTGGVLSADDLRQIAEFVRDRDLMVLSDEIYARIYYGNDAPFSIASIPGMHEKTIILDGFSKTYAMTGWRLGYGVMPEWLVDAVSKLMVNSNSCAATFTQRAAIEALNGPQDDVERMITEFRSRRADFCSALNQIPKFTCRMPEGAFYAFPNVTRTNISSDTLADMLLEEAGVACLDGAAFGDHGAGYLRFSYANSFENLREAISRIQLLSSRWA